MPSADYSPDFDWSILTVPEPMAMVRGQLGFSWMVLAERLDEIDDEAYLWEPAPESRSLRPRDQARTGNTTSLGDWVLEWPREGDPERMRTIAWLDADQVWPVGLSQATEIAQQAPFGHLALHVNREPCTSTANSSITEPRSPSCSTCIGQPLARPRQVGQADLVD